MSTKQKHPYIRGFQQQRKKMLKGYTANLKGHNRNWWKAWRRQWVAENKEKKE